jgi:hypothetical protein
MTKQEVVAPTEIDTIVQRPVASVTKWFEVMGITFIVSL